MGSTGWILSTDCWLLIGSQFKASGEDSPAQGLCGGLRERCYLYVCSFKPASQASGHLSLPHGTFKHTAQMFSHGEFAYFKTDVPVLSMRLKSAAGW